MWTEEISIMNEYERRILQLETDQAENRKKIRELQTAIAYLQQQVNQITTGKPS